jgi:pimeloyl-ACP methyl ester carboxylesterase
MTQDRFVQSKDGTAIHLLQSGAGPSLVLLHGGLQTSGSLSRLANELSGSFTVYNVDRRGRRPSGPFGGDYNMQKEIDRTLL